MSHELLRLKASLHNTPILATPEQLQIVEQYLDKRNVGDVELAKDKEGYEIGSGEVVNGIGYLNISGPLTYKPVMTLCGEGGTNYQSLHSQFESFVEQGVTTVLSTISSGGGEAYGCFEYANAIRQLATDNNIKMICYVEKMAASAAYAFAAINDEIVVNPQAEVGSIGVVVSLMNNSEAMQKEGYKRVFVTAGASKVPFDAEGGFKEEFIADLQSKVDVLYESFVDHVATSLNVSPDVIRSTEAKTFLPEKAMEYGLVDKVMTDFEFAAYLDQYKTKKEKKNMGFFNKKQANAEASQEEVEMNAELQVQVAELQKSLEGVTAELADYKSLMEEYKASAEAAKAELQAKVEADAQAKAEQRKADLAAVVGEASLDAMFGAVGGLDDASFALALNGFKAGNAAQKETDMFKELGTAAEAKAPEQKSAVEALAEAVAKNYSSK